MSNQIYLLDARSSILFISTGIYTTAAKIMRIVTQRPHSVFNVMSPYPTVKTCPLDNHEILRLFVSWIQYIRRFGGQSEIFGLMRTRREMQIIYRDNHEVEGIIET